MAKIERNQPCPCGSGKKYKKCCFNKDSIGEQKEPNKLDILMADGYAALEDKQILKACDIWLELWSTLTPKLDSQIKTIDDLDKVFSKKGAIHDWCQDLEIELGNASIKDPVYYEKRIAFCTEFCSLLPETEGLVLFNMKKAIALSHFGLGKQAAGETQFESLVKEFPRNVWGYIAWGDMYYQPLHESIKRNFEKAENLYQTALKKEKKETIDKKNIMEKSVATERLDELHKERTKM